MGCPSVSALHVDRWKVVQLFKSVYYKQVLNMRSFIVICLGLVLAVDGSTRMRRDECAQVTADQNKCAEEAYAAFGKAASKPDGKEHFAARKSCNYMTAVLDTCMENMVGDCHTQEEVDELKYAKIEDLMDKLQTVVTAWDPEKCPPFKRYIEQKKAKEDAANAPEPSADPEPAAAPASGKQQTEEDKTEDDKPVDKQTDDKQTDENKTNDGDNSGASTLVVSAL